MRRTREFPAKTLISADTVRLVGWPVIDATEFPPSFGWSRSVACSVSPVLALFGHGAMSELSPLTGV